MCLAFPAKIVEINGTESPRMATVDLGGVKIPVCLEWLPEAGVGDYVIVHVGFAISRLDEQDAQHTLRLLTGKDVTPGGTDAVH
jgi:hydrogenase expression/formation protein HypC